MTKVLRLNVLQVRCVFDDMYKAGLQPNIMTYITLLSSYAELGWWQPAVQILNHMCQPQVGSLPLALFAQLAKDCVMPFLKRVLRGTQRKIS